MFAQAIGQVNIPIPPSTDPSPTMAFYEGVKQIIISCPNPDYQGFTFGVRFTDSRAVVNPRIPNKFGYTVQELAVKFNLDLAGYTVEVDEWMPGYPKPGHPLYQAEQIEPEPSAEPPAVAGRRAAGLRGKVQED